MGLTIYFIAVMASLVASVLVSGCIEHNEYRGVHPPWTHVINDLRSLRATITSVRDAYPAVSDTRAVNGWLSSRDELASGLAEQISYEADFDPWGRPYVFVERDTSSHETWHRVHLYSLGEDGRTDSGGNDVDDLNTWDEMSHQNYVRRDNWIVVRRHLKRLAWIFPAFTAASLLAVRVVRVKPTPGPEQRDARES